MLNAKPTMYQADAQPCVIYITALRLNTAYCSNFFSFYTAKKTKHAITSFMQRCAGLKERRGQCSTRKQM